MVARFSFQIVLGLILLGMALPAGARPRSWTQQERPVSTSQYAFIAGGGSATASRDTVVLLGGPGRLDGRFQDAGNDPAWHGWTGVDHTIGVGNLWNVSTFNAEALGGHGPGNHAMWCGTVFANGDAGYGNDWQERLEWAWRPEEIGETISVQIRARLNHDTEPGFDFLTLQVARADEWQDLVSWSGWRIDREVDESVVLTPADLTGPGADEIRLRWFFQSDEVWSDEDGFYDTDGACQVDDVQVLVDGQEATFDDFEPGHASSWYPIYEGQVGCFAGLATNLQDLDPCRRNSSPQVVFVDDGLVVPGTGGSSCVTWCYGPGGYVVNSTGGLLGDLYHLDNGIVSPALAWPPESDDLLLEFEAYVHEPLIGESPGVVYRWRVRSTDSEDPAALEEAPWRSREVVFHGGPTYRRHHELAGDLLVPGRRWVQVELQVIEAGWQWGLQGNDATPAPYFDNVAVRAFSAAGPRLVAEDVHLPQDTFPAGGGLDLADLASNSCRFDMARNISPVDHDRNDPGDSVVVAVHQLRAGSQLLELPRMEVLIDANPLFDEVRIMTPDGDGRVAVTVEGDSCRTPDGLVVPSRWSFDLPDTGLIYPGDVLHFRFQATTEAGGVPVTVSWPADTTGFTDFNGDTGWPEAAIMRALPSVHSITPGDQPTILVWRDEPLPAVSTDDPWRHAMGMLDLARGVGYDLFRTRAPEEGGGNGLGGRATPDQIAAYTTLLYDCGDVNRHTLGNGDPALDPSDDLGLLDAWLQQDMRRAFFCGDNLASDVAARGGAGTGFLAEVLGAAVVARDASTVLAGQLSPSVAALAGNSVLSSLGGWRIQGGCPSVRTIDLLDPAGTAERLAEYLAADGSGGVYAQAALLRHVAGDPAHDVVTLPTTLSAVVSRADGGGEVSGVPARVLLLADVLTAFGQPLEPFVAAPPALVQTVSCRPNPFNPRATIAFVVPTSGRVTLKVYDLRGRLVRQLLDEERPAGPGTVVWDGTDADGRACASGIYLHELRSGAGSSLGKMTLIR